MSKQYIPEKNHIIWLDRPALVLTSKEYNKKTELLICCPISTSIRNSITEIPVNGLGQPSVVAANLIHTFSWRERKAKFIAEAELGVLEEVLDRLATLMGIDKILS